jgi:hypothetical protein
MKKGLLVALLLVLAIGFLVWQHRDKSERHAVNRPSSNNTNQASLPAQVSGGQTSAVPAATATAEPTPESNPAAWIEKRRKQIEDERQKGLNEWRTPISFYGKVMDETGMPVQGVRVDFGCNDLSVSGTSTYQTTTDANGLFSITGIKGKQLSVSLSIGGYYVSKRDKRYFTYAGENVNFVPDILSPVLFRLRKKAKAEPLIHIQAIMGGPKGFRVARDGTPLEISLTTGQTTSAGQGDIRVQCWTDDQGKSPGEHYDWRCRISVPNGGLLQYTNEFPFEAPLDGYQQFDEINMPASIEKGWQRNAGRSYFVKLGSGNYARMTFKMIAGGDHFCQLESFLNPSGSRNLEADPSRLFPDVESYKAYIATNPQTAK